MPDERPKAPPFEPDPAKHKAPPLPDAPAEMPGRDVATPPSFSDEAFDQKRRDRVEVGNGFDERQDLESAVKRSDAQAFDKEYDAKRTDKRLAAAAVEEKIEAQKPKAPPLPEAPKLAERPQAPPLPDAPDEPKTAHFPATEKQAIKETAPALPDAPPQDKPKRAEPAAEAPKPDATNPVDLSAVMKRLDEIYGLLEQMPKIMSSFGRLS